MEGNPRLTPPAGRHALAKRRPRPVETRAGLFVAPILTPPHHLTRRRKQPSGWRLGAGRRSRFSRQITAFSLISCRFRRQPSTGVFAAHPVRRSSPGRRSPHAILRTMVNTDSFSASGNARNPRSNCASRFPIRSRSASVIMANGTAMRSEARRKIAGAER